MPLAIAAILIDGQNVSLPALREFLTDPEFTTLHVGPTGVGSAQPVEFVGAEDAGVAVTAKGTALGKEAYFAGFVVDGLGVAVKGAVTAMQRTDGNIAAGTFYASWNEHATKCSGAGVTTDEFGLVHWGGNGAEIFPPDLTAASAPGVGVFRVRGALTVTSNAIITGSISGNAGSTKVSDKLFVGTSATVYGTEQLAALAAGSQQAAAFANVASAAATLVAINRATSGDNLLTVYATDADVTRGSVDFNRGGTAIRFNTTSDETLKTFLNESPEEKSVELLRASAGVIGVYHWNDDPTKKKQIGPSAQKLHEVYPGAVSVGGMHDERYQPWGADKTAFAWHSIVGWNYHDRLIQELRADLNKYMGAHP